MIAPTTDRRSTLVSDLAVTFAMAVLVAGMCVALAWMAPLELFPPRIR
jgi:hypothetical protein